MNKRSTYILGALLSALLVSGCADKGEKTANTADVTTAGPIAPDAELPEGHPPLAQRQDQMIAPVDPGAGTGASGLTWDAPESWAAETPANTMRRAQFRVPGPGGDGECVVFYFGPGQGGDAMGNAVRWANQFTQPDGSASTERMKTEQVTVGAIEVLRVEVSGTYQSGGPMMGQAGQSLPGYMLLGAVAEGADANWFFKFTGPRDTVEANRSSFDEMLGSLRAGA
ncbi:MAG: hypothetical protein GY769_05075 [bacterium]|nr:hypothetical protein [bacterium]